MKLVLLGWLLTAQAYASTDKALNIIVDPGHGGSDRGATRGKIHESTITLKVSKYLAALLHKDPRFKTSLTRTSNRYVSLVERTRLAHKKQGDLFISIHVNSSEDHRAKGGEFYFQNQLPPSEESLFLAGRENGQLPKHESQFEKHTKVRGFQNLKNDVKSIVLDLEKNNRIKLSGQLTETLVKSWRGFRKSRKNTIRQAPFYVISHVNMPSALIELGFLSNSREAKKLISPEYQRKLAQSLYEGIVNFKDLIDKQPLTDLH